MSIHKFPNRAFSRSSKKVKAPPLTVLVRSRAPTQEEADLGASQVFERKGRDGKEYEVLVGDMGETCSQFGAPLAVLEDNNSDACTWHRKLRESRYREFDAYSAAGRRG